MINKRKFKNHNLLKVNKYGALQSPFETLIIRWSLVRAQVGPQVKSKPYSNVGLFFAQKFAHSLHKMASKTINQPLWQTLKHS